RAQPPIPQTFLAGPPGPLLPPQCAPVLPLPPRTSPGGLGPPHPAGARPGGQQRRAMLRSPNPGFEGEESWKNAAQESFGPGDPKWCLVGVASGVNLPPVPWGPPAPQGCSKQAPSGCFWRWPGLAVLGLAAGPGTGRVWERRWSCHLHPNRFHNPGEEGALLPLALLHPMGGSGEQEAEGPHVPSGASGVQRGGRSGSHALHGSRGAGGFGVRPDPAGLGVSHSSVDTIRLQSCDLAGSWEDMEGWPWCPSCPFTVVQVWVEIWGWLGVGGCGVTLQHHPHQEMWSKPSSSSSGSPWSSAMPHHELVSCTMGQSQNTLGCVSAGLRQLPPHSCSWLPQGQNPFDLEFDQSNHLEPVFNFDRGCLLIGLLPFCCWDFGPKALGAALAVLGELWVDRDG
ncbi:hypothetical protein DV515_00016014, partial [Chloebia gouldiae]